MARYAQGYKGPMTTAGPARPVNKAAPVSGPQPFLDAVSPRRPPVNPRVGLPAPPPGMIAPPTTVNPRVGPPQTLRPAPGGAGVANSTIGRTGANLLGSGGPGMKKGGAVKKMASKGKVSSASKRADGCAARGKTRGRMV